MEKTFLTGVAVLFLATGTAHAKWKPKPPSTFLPAEMQGYWCRDNDQNKWDTFHRGGCSGKKLWTIWSNGWTIDNKSKDTCTFIEIDKLDRYVYYVRGICKAKRNATLPKDVPNEGMSAWTPSGNSVYEEVRELHFIDGALVMWDLPDV
jgi:hypothetical protein